MLQDNSSCFILKEYGQMNTNQIGRELTRRLIEAQGCDIQTAIRFFYNSELYSRLSPADDTDIDKLYSDFEQEFLQGS